MKTGDMILGGIGVFVMGSYFLGAGSSASYSGGGNEEHHGMGYIAPIGTDLTDRQLLEAILLGKTPSSEAESAPMVARMQADYSLEHGTMAAVSDPAFQTYLRNQVDQGVEALSSKEHDKLHFMAANAKEAAADINLSGHTTLLGLLHEVESRANSRGGA
jgi:hypothetical protein